MAKLKFGSVVTEASGKLGGHVFAKQNGTAYIKTNTGQKNNTNIEAQKQKSNTNTIISLWSKLTNEQRLKWNEAANLYNKKNMFGDNVVYSGFQIFNKLNQGRLIARNTLLSVPTSKMNYDEYKPCTISATTNELLIQSSGYDADTFIVIYATPALQNGVTKADRYYKQIAATGATYLNAGLNLVNQYNAVFGGLVAGTFIQVGFKIVNSVSGWSNGIIYSNADKIEVTQTNYYNLINSATPIPNEVEGIDGCVNQGTTITSDNTTAYNSLYSIKLAGTTGAYGNMRNVVTLERNTNYQLIFDAKRTGTGMSWCYVTTPTGTFAVAVGFSNNDWETKSLNFVTPDIDNPLMWLRWFPYFDAVSDNICWIDNIKIYKL